MLTAPCRLEMSLSSSPRGEGGDYHSVAGWGTRGFQVLDVGININLELADFVYRPLRHDGEVFGVLWKDVRP